MSIQTVIPWEFYISSEILERSQREWAEYLRVLIGIMDDMRYMNREKDSTKLIRRFSFVYDKIITRIMIILMGVTDTNDRENLIRIYHTYTQFQNNQKYLNEILRYSESDGIVAGIRTVLNRKIWIGDVYSFANEIFTYALLCSDNKLYPAFDWNSKSIEE